MTPIPVDREERLAWAILRRFEGLAVAQYQAHAPALLTEAKRQHLDRLQQVDIPESDLAAHTLAAPLDALLGVAQGTSHLDTLVVQGLVLELLGLAIYRALAEGQSVSEETRTMGLTGATAAWDVHLHAAAMLRDAVGEGEPAFQAFATASRPVLARLDGMADGVDEAFADRFDLTFSDLLAEFSADLVSVCLALDMDRRRVVCQVTGALMGI